MPIDDNDGDNDYYYYYEDDKNYDEDLKFSGLSVLQIVSWVMTLQNDRQVAEFHNNLITYYTNATSPWRLYLTLMIIY